MASYRDPELKEERDLETPHMSYARRERSRSKVPGSTMGPIGTVDFDDLVKQSRGMFVDRDFPANDHSVYTDGQRSGFGAITRAVNVKWLRPHEFKDVEQPELFYDDADDDTGDGGAEANDIIQGMLGDCYFLSALAIMCTSEGLGLVEKLFVEMKYFHKGLVGVKFFKNGLWWDVAIDTLLPTMDGRIPLFARNKDKNEFWMSLLEKAYAKMHGCYEALDAGSMDDALVDLTGAAPGSIRIKELFCAVQDARGHFDKEKALQLLSQRTFGTLLQGAGLEGGDEQEGANGLISGHAYSINKTKKTSQGDVLVRLRNPWGQGEWKGKWHDKDPLWTAALKREMGQSDKDDGMFWMSVDDFTKEFTTITYCDLVPRNFTVLRAETEWTSTTAGGMGRHWKANPQLLMRVSQKSHITMTLNQPDTRMLFSKHHQNPPLTKDDFWNLYGNGNGYETAMIFFIFKGSERKVGHKGIYAKSQYSAVRTLSLTLPDVEPGDYIIVPALEDEGVTMKARMRFWSSAPIELIDTKGGKDWQIFDASDDAINVGPNEPLPQTGVKIPVEKAPEPQFKPEENFYVKKDPGHINQSTVLENIKQMAAMASWKIGDYAPVKWESGKDYFMGASSVFAAGEICCVMRPDKSLRFAKIVRDCGNGCYDIMTAVTEWGFMYKFGVPSQFICKLPYEGHAPAALIYQVGEVFDLLDTNMNGTLDLEWDSEKGITGEIMTDVGKRLLVDMEIDTEDIPLLIKHMKQLDSNGDGIIDREEFVYWMSSRKIKLADSEHHVGTGIE